MLDLMLLEIELMKGGSGSGNFGHAGIQGHEGGSAPSGGGEGFVRHRPDRDGLLRFSGITPEGKVVKCSGMRSSDGTILVSIGEGSTRLRENAFDRETLTVNQGVPFAYPDALRAGMNPREYGIMEGTKLPFDPFDSRHYVEDPEEKKKLRGIPKDVQDLYHGEYQMPGGISASLVKGNPKITFAEKESAVHYATPEGYRELNGKLRDGVGPQSADDHIRNLDGAISRSSLAKNAILYRGIEDFDTIPTPGSILYDKGYVSTSLHAEVSTEFAGGKGVTLRISAKAGQKGLYLEPHVQDQEFEVLLPRGTRLRLGRMYSLPDGSRFLEAEYTDEGEE